MVAEAEGSTGRFELYPSGPYSIPASARFLEGFAPAHYEGGGPEHLRFAFIADGLHRGEQIAGACVSSEGEKVVVDTYGEAAPETVRDQVERVLSLDVDGSGFPAVGDVGPGSTAQESFGSVGVDVAEVEQRKGRRRFAFACPDWTEHQPHLGGALGAAICGRFFEEGWVEKDQKTRAVRLTDAGRSALEGRLGLVADGVGA